MSEERRKTIAAVTVTVDGKAAQVPRDSTILAAARLAGIEIPTLCHMEEQEVRANCRICGVEVEGMKMLQPACATAVREGMVIRTDSAVIRQARKTNLELILSNHSWDCHHCLRIGNYETAELDEELCSFCFFCDCVKDGDCQLQALAKEYDVNTLPFERQENQLIDDSTGSVVRNPNKCIKCRRCIDVCSNVQSVHALSAAGRGGELQIQPALNRSLADSPCVRCGKCIEACPTGAIFAKEQYDEMLYAVRLLPEKRTVAFLSPEALPELTRILKAEPEAVTLSRIAAGLEKIGVDHVVCGEETLRRAGEDAAAALADRLRQAHDPTGSGADVILVSDNAAAIRFVKEQFSQLTGSLLTLLSAEQIFGRTVKGAWAEQLDLNPDNLCTVTLSADCSCKDEALQPGSLVDFVLTPREAARMFNKTAVDVVGMQEEKWNFAKDQAADELLASLLKEPAAGREDADCLAGLMPLFEPVFSGADEQAIREVELCFDGKTLKGAVACTLGACRRLSEQILAGSSPYDIIRFES